MGEEGETLGKEDRDAEYAYEREVGALELEVKEMGQKIIHFRRTIPDQFKKSLSFVLVSQRPVVSMVDRLRLQSTEMSTSDSEPLGQQIGSNKDLMLSKEDLEISKKLELLKSRISSNLSSMPLILKRMNDCIARMDKLDQSGLDIPLVFKRRKTN